MKEKEIIAQIRKKMLERLNVPLTKYWGGPYSEVGVSDLFGCLPGGRAVFLEVKAPGGMPKETDTVQHRYLAVREKLGAFCMMVNSWEMLEERLRKEGYI